MHIEYANRKLEKVLNDAARLQKEYGPEQASKIQSRLEMLKAAANLSEVPAEKPIRCHLLKGDYAGDFAVDLKQPYRLIFKPLAPIERLSDGGIDKAKVKEILIKGVVDYHGE